MAEILLGVTGSIAAYKAADLCSRLVRRGHGVTVAMTGHARSFVGELTFATLSGRAVLHDGAFGGSYPRHVELADLADLAVVAPATANILAKMAGGIADDALSTVLLSLDCPVIVAPAMNVRMWRHPATVENVARLRVRGAVFVGPGEGRLACGAEGEGRMAEPAEIEEAVGALLEGR